jgi:hypothetical protein
MAATTRREFLRTFWRRAPAAPAPPRPSTGIPCPTASSASVPTVTSSEPLRLPPLQQTVLDVATTDALFRDLAACTTIQAVIPKYARNAPTGSGTITLEQARTRLAAGLLLGVQIRYGYEGHSWCDTLLRRPAGLTLVRIRETDIAATLEPTAGSPAG